GMSMRYPDTFTRELVPLDPHGLSAAGQRALGQLHIEGFEVEVGLRRQDVADITEIAGQEWVREFCPNDLDKRFGDEQMVEAWLAKNGGRGVFLLRHVGERALAGYGWTGAEATPELPDCETTFAVRLNEQYAGNGLGTPFTTAIVSGSMAVFGACRTSLETWASNASAIRTYTRVGAQLVTTRDDRRPTLRPAPNETDGMRRDVRLFMVFPQTFFRMPRHTR
ncbi:MAG TPA: GNAT family N-acetyltransferase, partial [Candidatus Saccharimonadales bacterium]|nr:GNAT family N-acetyltransferase [Candidatus Saccharimonadales bacterium]